MIRLYLILFCLVLSSCGSRSVNKPTLLWNAENYTDDAMQAYMDDDWNRAQQLFNDALSLYQSIDDRPSTLASHINLVEVALAMHDNQAAYRHLHLAEDIVKTETLKNHQPRITLLYALLAMQQKQITKASGFLHELLPATEGEAAVTIPDAIQLIAIASQTEIAFVQQQNESLWTLRYANALKKSANKNTGLEARLLRFQSKLGFQQGDYNKSDVLLQQALSMYKNSLSRPGIAGTLLELGKLHQKQGGWQYAERYFNRAIAVYRSLGNIEKVDKVTKVLAKVKSERSKSDAF